MPVISVNRDSLFTSLGRNYTEEEFEDLCFEFGIELDDVVVEDNKSTTYKIDLPANRYDLLCLEGLSRALLIFLGKATPPTYKSVIPNEEQLKKTQITVKKETSAIRPFIVGAILRGVTFNAERYESFIALQDHLHRNICRKRTLVAIGTHDLSTLEGPFTYEALKPTEINFKHLFAEKEMNAKEMLDWFRTEPEGKHIKEYTGIIYDSPVYPVIYDSNRTVLSLPPIINGRHSKLTLDTRDVFIECTATDLTKANIVLNTVIAMFSEYCEKPFTCESVRVVYEENNEVKIYPELSTRSAEADVKTVREYLNVSESQLSNQEIAALCERMQLGPVKVQKDKVVTTVPVTRSDILHECDIIEDVAIAYGYNNIKHNVPLSHTPGGEQKLNFISDMLRNDLARMGYTEMMSLGLCSHDENYKWLNQVDEGKESVVLANPKTIEFQVVRTSLIPGTLKTLAENKSLKFSDGIKLFEVSDVVLLRDDGLEEGCRNERRVVCLYAGMNAGVEIVHAAVDRIMQVYACIPSKEYCEEAWENVHVQNLLKNDAHCGEYILEAAENGTFFPDMCADIKVKLKGSNDWKKVGTLGALHPLVLENFKLPFACSLAEMNIEVFL